MSSIHTFVNNPISQLGCYCPKPSLGKRVSVIRVNSRMRVASCLNVDSKAGAVESDVKLGVGNNSKEVMEMEAKYLVGTYARAPVVLESGNGCKVRDVDGREYLDLASGIAVNALGHGHEGMCEAALEQFKKLVHVSNVYYNVPQVELAKRLVDSSFADRVFFTNSGTEANEAAIKFSRKFQRHSHPNEENPATEFISFSNSFHGRTMGALALTSKENYRLPFAPVMPGVTFTEYGNIEATRALIKPGKTAAVFVEPLQGEGGIYSATKEFLQYLRSACDEAGALLVFDEVQCGLGRTGYLWAHEAYGVYPDIMTLLDRQEELTLKAASFVVFQLGKCLEPLRVVTDETGPWEERSGVVRLDERVRKLKRNRGWRKRKRRRVAEAKAKERDRFEEADRQADEWRAREIAKDIAQQKVEKMKAIAKLKAKEERKRLESELELVLIVEKLKELRNIRIQKLKKQGHFLAEEDDKFFERVRAAVEEEEREAIAAADTDAAKDAIATAEESRQVGDKETQHQNDQIGCEKAKEPSAAAKEESGKQKESHCSVYDAVANLPDEFYHYYYGSSRDMGTLVEVRRVWDSYIRPGGSRIPGHWVQPPPPADEVWASYLVKPK